MVGSQAREKELFLRLCRLLSPCLRCRSGWKGVSHMKSWRQRLLQRWKFLRVIGISLALARICGICLVQSPCSSVAPPVGCKPNGSAQHVTEEDAGLHVAPASDAWHRGQRMIPLHFSRSAEVAMKGRDVHWDVSLNATPIIVPPKGGRQVHPTLLAAQRQGTPLLAVVERSRSLLALARMPLRSLSCSRGQP